MNAFLLYLLLLKATLTSFSGLSSMPAVRDELVVRRPLLTDRQLNTAIAIARVSPGPFGLYLVPVGYYAAGGGGAVAGFAAMVTPAFLVLVFLRFLAQKAMNPRAQAAIQAVTYASAGLILAALVPLARDALATGWQIGLALLVTAVLTLTEMDTIWAVALGAVCGLLLASPRW